MKTRRLMLFGYDFEHKKTQDFLFYLYIKGYEIAYAVLAPWKKLSISKNRVRTDVRHTGLLHPEEICNSLDIDYLVADHNSKEAHAYMEKRPVDLGVVAGARILSSDTLAAVGNNVVNVHPGLIPEMRGLDTLLWSIHENVPPGISVHFIGEKIDAGRLILTERLPVFKDDSVYDVSLRWLELQPEVLVQALERLDDVEDIAELDSLDEKESRYHSTMPTELETHTIEQFEAWRDAHLREPKDD